MFFLVAWTAAHKWLSVEQKCANVVETTQEILTSLYVLEVAFCDSFYLAELIPISLWLTMNPKILAKVALNKLAEIEFEVIPIV